jgi:hypothetical protein
VGKTVTDRKSKAQAKKRRERQREYLKTHPVPKEKSWRYHLKSNYKISPEDFDLMFSWQNGLCAICGCSASNGRRLHVDHNHTTGGVRGLLCTNCNLGLGLFKDSEGLLLSAISYLKDKDNPNRGK